MPVVFRMRISTKVGGVSKAIRKEQDAFLKDTGRFVRERWRAGLPRRTGQARAAVKLGDIQQTGSSLFVEVGSKEPRVRWLEEGTGIYGPRKKRIYPKTAKALAWRTLGARMYGVKGGKIGPGYANTQQLTSGIAYRSGKVIKSPRRSVYIQFARSIRGMKGGHAGKAAFKGPETAAFRRQRKQQMVERIKAAEHG